MMPSDHGFAVTKKLLDAISADAVERPAYRGHSDVTWALTPAVWRQERKGIANRNQLVRWRELTEPLVPHIARDALIRWLVLAQHHGIATTLLDWTWNPLVALYFACSEHPKREGVIIRLRTRSYGRSKGGDIFDVGGVTLVDPHGLHPRAYSQLSVMTLHAERCKTVDEANVKTLITLSPNEKQLASQELEALGVTGARLFADVVGAANQFRSEIGDLGAER